MNEEMNTPKNNIMKIAVILLSVISVGSLGFIAYDKLIKKENPITEENKEDNNKNENPNSEINASDDEIYKKNNTMENAEKRLDYIISDDEKLLLKNLVFPISYVNGSSWLYGAKLLDDFNVSKMSREEKMTWIANRVSVVDLGHDYDENTCEGLLKYENGGCYNLYVKETDFINQYKAFWGPDIEYKSGDFIEGESFPCGTPYKYDEKSKAYWGSNACGGDGPGGIRSLVTKVEKNDNQINVYISAAKLFSESDLDSESNSENEYIFDASATGYTKDDYIWYGNIDNIDLAFKKLVESKKLNTYKFTFKKQSDGKYYVYSGEWQWQ